MIIITLTVLDTSCPCANGKTFINLFDKVDSSFDIDDITNDISNYIELLGDNHSK